ncbi:hypothetical protein D3C81_1149470 [compost metagenome]
MLGITQELIPLAQLSHHRRWQITLALKGRKDLEQGALLQAQVTSTMNKLKSLGDELDLTNTTGTQLDVVGHALAPHFLLDQLLHGAQRFNGREVQIAPINEGPQHIQQLRPSHLIAGHHPRLDHRVALPITTLILVVLLQGIEAQYQRASRTVRTQTHVHAEHEAVDRDRVQGLDQALPEAGEELLIIQRAFDPFGLATFGEGEDQVDVR